LPRVDATSFDTLRDWDGQQSRAFEEISFQLLKSEVPAGTRAVRTGNPDGGVEWYVTLADGTEWGWQAKHVHGIDALLTAMTGSVDRVTKERPDLRKLTFVISWNLATGKGAKNARGRKSQREKYKDKITAWKKDIPGADKIEFDLVQGSDLLDELAKPEHNGRRWFWWNQVVLGPEWLASRYKQQDDAAGEKYRPDLQVDVPIQEELSALGFDQDTLAAFNRLLRGIVFAVTELDLWVRDQDETTTALYQAAQDIATAVSTTAGAIVLQAGDGPAVLGTLRSQLTACQSAIDAVSEHERERRAAWQNLAADDPRKANKPPEDVNRYRLRGLASAMDALLSWLDSPVGRAFQSRAYFLTGQAGAGKTHLLLDATGRALNAGRPAVFLAGGQFGQSDLWASITGQLGLEPVGADILLHAMDAAGEAASASGSRFVIFVDALNETTPADFWRVHLPALRAAIAPYPHVALAVSCRDTYEDLVLEGTEGSRYIRRAHPGFAEREVEATQKYFAATSSSPHPGSRC